MAGMIKLILLVTLTAVAFLPRDGVDALICTNESPFEVEAGTTAENCTNNNFCYTSVHNLVGIILGCTNINRDDKLDNKLCVDVAVPAVVGPEPSMLAKYCYCNLTDFCNSHTPNLPPDFVRYPPGSGPHPTTSARPPTGSNPPSTACGRFHSQSSSVLSLCIVLIFLSISFFGKP